MVGLHTKRMVVIGVKVQCKCEDEHRNHRSTSVKNVRISQNRRLDDSKQMNSDEWQDTRRR